MPWTRSPAFLIGSVTAILWYYDEGHIRHFFAGSDSRGGGGGWRVRGGFLLVVVVLCAVIFGAHGGSNGVPPSW